MESNTLLLTLIATAAGLSAALLTWLIGHSMASVPPEDRSYKDPPPLAMRLLWWPIQWIGQPLGPRLGTGTSVRTLQLKLRQAGLDSTPDPAQFIASRIVRAFVATALLWRAVSSFDGPALGAR